MAARRVMLFTDHLAESEIDKMTELQRNVRDSLSAVGVVALVPNHHNALECNDHLKGVVYETLSSASASPLVISQQLEGTLSVFALDGHSKNDDTMRTALIKATRENGIEARKTSSEGGYSLKRCYNAAKPKEDAAHWTPWLGSNDYASASVLSSGFDNKYFVVVKTDSGAAGRELYTHICSLIKDNDDDNVNVTYGQLLLDPKVAAVRSAVTRNAGRIASKIAKDAGMAIKEIDDDKVVVQQNQALPRYALAAIEQSFNTFAPVPSKGGLGNKYVGFFDKASPITAATKHVLVPISPDQGIRVYQPMPNSITDKARMVGVPFGSGRATPEQSEQMRTQLQGVARQRGQVSAMLNDTFSWPGRAPDRHDNAELWRYTTISRDMETRIEKLLGSDVAVATLKPIHVCLPFSTSDS